MMVIMMIFLWEALKCIQLIYSVCDTESSEHFPWMKFKKKTHFDEISEELCWLLMKRRLHDSK